MASASQATLKLPPLTKQSMAELVAKAKRLGVPPEDYAQRLVVEGLALQREAEDSSFAAIMGPVRDASGTVTDSEVVKLVQQARGSRQSSSGRGKKR